jgi:hypothetical protein
MKLPRCYNTQMYQRVFSHTQLTLLRMFVIWQLVCISSVGPNQATAQNVDAPETKRHEVGDLTLPYLLH